jgi:uncharacterized protein
MKISLTVISVLVILTTLIALGHSALYQAIVTFCAVKSHHVLWALRVALGILSLSFVFASVLVMTTQSAVGNVLYTASALWMGTFFWLLIASALGGLIFYVARLSGVDTLVPIIVGRTLLVVALLTSGYGVYNSNTVQVTRYTVALKNLPSVWQDKIIVMVADTHFGNVYGKERAQKLVRMIEDEKPEAVLIPGDFYDGPLTDFKEVAKLFAGINTKHGVFFSSGNHETYRGLDMYVKPLAEAGIHVIDGRTVDIDGLQIIGIPYLTPSYVSGSDPLRPSIALKHVPQGMDVVNSKAIDLQVSGHTHSGQMWPASLIAKKLFGQYVYGQHMFKDLNVITTSGAGTWGPPQRIGTKSEIVVITLVKK